MTLPELREASGEARREAHEDIRDAKKRRFAHFGLENSASARSDEVAVLRRLRFALVGDGAADGHRRKGLGKAHLARTLGGLGDALVPTGRRPARRDYPFERDGVVVAR